MGAIPIREVFRKIGLRPVAKKEALEVAPEPFKGMGLIELEKKHSQWDGSAREVHVDEVIMGNVLQAGQGRTLPVKP